VQFVKMQADLLHELDPDLPVTVNLRALPPPLRPFRHGGRRGFCLHRKQRRRPSNRPPELACDIDMLRSLKKTDIKTPDGDCGFWAMEQKAGQVNWQDVNSLVRPGLIRLFTYQLISRGASGILYFRWRQPRIGSEKFYGAVLPHHLEGNRRVFRKSARSARN
jgi:beta-galactosidase